MFWEYVFILIPGMGCAAASDCPQQLTDLSHALAGVWFCQLKIVYVWNPGRFVRGFRNGRVQRGCGCCCCTRPPTSPPPPPHPTLPSPLLLAPCCCWPTPPPPHPTPAAAGPSMAFAALLLLLLSCVLWPLVGELSWPGSLDLLLISRK
jgi:hypothetical protein